MNILILKLGSLSLKTCLYSTDTHASLREDRLGREQISGDLRDSMPRLVQCVLKECRADLQGAEPHAIAVYSAFGGDAFREPELVHTQTMSRLQSLITSAPMHTPALMLLLRTLSEAAPDVPVVLHFGTSFFSRLPERETLYGLDPAIMKSLHIRRFGFHGPFHEAVCRQINETRKSSEKGLPRRIVSICLEPRPEVAAILGNAPVMVSSGVTPLEGIPGHTTCGEIDPAIALVLSQQLKWGPEQISNALTNSGGIRALTGDKATIGDVLQSRGGKYELARNVLQYRIQLAVGSAVAALSGIDAIAVSGRFATAGEGLTRWLLSRPFFKNLQSRQKIETVMAAESLNAIIADKTFVAVHGQVGLTG